MTADMLADFEEWAQLTDKLTGQAEAS